MCVCDIAKLLDMTQSAISHQLRVLKQARLVKSRRDGKQYFIPLLMNTLRPFFIMQWIMLWNRKDLSCTILIFILMLLLTQLLKEQLHHFRKQAEFSLLQTVQPADFQSFAGIAEKKHLILPVATKPSQQTNINNWAAEIQGEDTYCCGSVHPDAEDVLDEIERIKSLGLCGVKLHPEYQLFILTRKKCCRFTEKLRSLDFCSISWRLGSSLARFCKS